MLLLTSYTKASNQVPGSAGPISITCIIWTIWNQSDRSIRPSSSTPLGSSEALILHHVSNSHTSQWWHHKQEKAHCMRLADYLLQFSLSVPINNLPFRVFHPVHPFFLAFAPVYTTNPKPSTDWLAIGVILFSNGNLVT